MPKVTLTCDQCGKKIEKWPSRVKRTKHHFCSSECQYEWSKEAFRGENNSMYGKHHSKETRRKISEAKKGRVPWNKGKTGIYSEEALRKMGEGRKGHKGVVPWNKGKHRSEETRRKISEANKGQIPWIKGEHLSEEHKRKISETLKGTNKGENNPAWNGGSSFEPYPLEFNDELREQIRTRDNYTCQMCGEPGKQIHHIDYDKENNDPSNLITLCHSCHSKTNFNRDQWILYFNDLMALGVLKND